MGPTVEQMRQAIIGRYKNDAWAKRVKQMRDKQVQAIYFRLLEANMLQKEQKPKRLAMPEVIPVYKGRPAVFMCPDCNALFDLDNDDAEECIFCGSKNIYKKWEIDNNENL